MTEALQHPPQPAPPARDRSRGLLRMAIWVAIGALIAAAIVCVVWVLIGPENDIIGRAFLTILLLAAFAGVAILDVHLSERRPAWFALTSMITWVVTLLVGAFLIWMPTEEYGFEGFTRFVSFLAVILVLQLALLHVRLYIKSLARHITPFTQTIAGVTVALVASLAVMLVLPLTFHEFIDFRDLYWRIVVAITILAAVGTALIPLMNALFAPKRPRPEPAPYAALPAPYAALPAQGGAAYAPEQPALLPWPTFADGVTPLPVMPDGSPDWNAYYTGYPTYPQQHGLASGSAPQAHPPVEQQQAYPAAEPQAYPPEQQPQAYPPAEQQPQAYPPAEQQQQPGYPGAPQPGYEGFPPPPPAPR
ncbi:hypothetical protein E4V99_10150 [Microbacterium sp. dk485]|uniref:hypothetical protein n=1 Tax=Microbacterium sp. dk485 TaxID=2560021 RepID=UPI001073BD02|nr:hypothetical protein [Microbacterium sp. dk485]TFV85342.1 hypothetical protein E4V99_10150 [Microbacterium sp. dk485]